MARKAEVIITCDASTVKQVLEGLNREMEKTNQRRQQLQQKQQAGIRLTKTEEKELQQLVKYENALAEKQQKVSGEMKKYGEVMKDLAGSKTKDLKRALNEVKRALDNMSSKDPKRAQLVNDLKRIQNQIDANTASVKKQQGAFGSLGTTMKNLFAYAGVFAGFNKLKSLVEGVFQANLKLSDSLANIRKVSGLTTEDINKLYRNISRIDSRNTIETLNNLAYTGAKLGIGQNYGVQGLTGFVKAAEQVQMALGEDMGEKALPELAKMTEVMGLIQKYGVEQAMQKTASSIFQLGATSTATGTNIVEFSKRLYGLANVSNVTADELLGLGSAADAMGLMPEVAATAFNKLFTSLQRNHNLIEKSLSIPPGTINELYSAGKTMDAIVLVFEKMKETGNLNALGGVFKDLGSDGARLVNVMATMSDRVDMLKEHLKTSNQAFKDGTAVVNEYMIQNNTAAALMDRASNLWAKAFTNPEGVDMVKQFAEKWYEVSKALTQSESSMYSMRLSLEMIAASVTKLIQMLPFLIKLIAWFGVFKGISVMVTGFQALVVSIRAATGAMGTLNTVMKSNWAIAAISAAVAGISLLYDKMNAASEAAERMRKRQAELDVVLRESKKSIDEVTNTLENEKKVIDKSNKSQEARNKLLAQLLQGSYEVYLNYLGIEIDKTTNLADAYAAVVKVMRQKKALEEREKFREEVNGETRRNVAQEGSDVFRRGMALGLDGIVINGKKRTLAQWLDMTLLADEKDIAKKVQEALGMTYSRQAITGNAVLNTNGVDWDEYKDLMAAIRSYRSTKRTANLNDFYVDEQFRDLVGGFDQQRFDEELAKINLRNRGGLDVDKPDKQALAAARKAAQERKQAARKELQDLTRESDAIMDKIEEFYRLQETTIEAAVADGQKTRAEADAYLRELKISKNQTLAQVRGVLSGKLQFSDGQWAQFVKDNLLPIMADQGEWSAELAMDIEKTSLNTIANLLRNFNGKWAGTEISSTALIDKIAKGRAGNLREVQRTRAKVVEEVEKILMEYEFIEQANRSFHDDLVGLGMMSETYEQYVKRMQEEAARRREEAARLAANPDLTADHEIGEVTVTARRPVYNYEAALRQQFLASGTKPFSVNPQDREQLLLWLKNLVTNYQYDAEMDDWKVLKEDWTRGFPMLDQWIEDIDTYMPDVQMFYFNLIKMEEKYYKARKDTYEHYKKQNEQIWEESGRKDYYDQTYTRLQNQKDMRDTFGSGQNFGQQYGLYDVIANDPEVELYKQKLQAAAEYYQFVESHQHTEQELREAGQKTLEAFMAMAKKVGDEVAERAAKIQELQAPATEFAEAVGQKWGDMMFNMESSSDTWNGIVKKMILSFAQMTVKMAAENLTKKIQQALFYKQMQAMEIEHQTTLLGIQQAFGTMQIGAQQAINTTLQTQKSVDDAQTVSKEVSLATILTQLGISEGAAKTIGKLGWWGIPLVAVISSLLLGLLSSALSTANKSTEAASTSTSNASKMKLVSGMLTYDEGNVGNYVGQDGNVYQARNAGGIPDGVSLVKSPIATTVNGQPSLVAERGPEIVIGRRTTRAIMMNEPSLLHHLANFDQRHRALRLFDNGNMGALDGLANGSLGGEQPAFDSDTAQALKALPAVMAALTEQLKKPVHINMYGHSGLYENLDKAQKLMSKYD